MTLAKAAAAAARIEAEAVASADSCCWHRSCWSAAKLPYCCKGTDPCLKRWLPSCLWSGDRRGGSSIDVGRDSCRSGRGMLGLDFGVDLLCNLWLLWLLRSEASESGFWGLKDTLASNHWSSTGLPLIKLPCMVLRARHAIWWLANSTEAQPAERPDLWVKTCEHAESMW